MNVSLDPLKSVTLVYETEIVLHDWNLRRVGETEDICSIIRRYNDDIFVRSKSTAVVIRLSCMTELQASPKNPKQHRSAISTRLFRRRINIQIQTILTLLRPRRIEQPLRKFRPGFRISKLLDTRRSPPRRINRPLRLRHRLRQPKPLRRGLCKRHSKELIHYCIGSWQRRSRSEDNPGFHNRSGSLVSRRGIFPTTASLNMKLVQVISG